MEEAPQPFNFVHSNRRVISAWGGIDKLADLAKESRTQRPMVVMDSFFENGELAARIAGMLYAACGLNLHFTTCRRMSRTPIPSRPARQLSRQPPLT